MDVNYYGTDREADYDYVGDPGQYVQCNGMPTIGPCNSIEEVKAEIEAHHAEMNSSYVTGLINRIEELERENAELAPWRPGYKELETLLTEKNNKIEQLKAEIEALKKGN
jgi:hypothetical protein